MVDAVEQERRHQQSQRDKAKNRQKSSRNTSNISRVSIMEAPSYKLMRDMTGMFNNTKFSDARVVIYDVILPIHKSIVCTRCSYFEKAFQDTFVEGKTGGIIFQNGSGAAHWRVLEYLYTCDYSDDLSTKFEDDLPLLKDPRVYALADMFSLDDVKALATSKLQQKLENLWQSDSFPDCVREIYASTPDSDRAMRSAVVDIAKAHAGKLRTKAAFRDLVREGRDFTVDFLESLTLSMPSGTLNG